MTAPTCISCNNWNLKDSGAMAKQGFAKCKLKPIWNYSPPLNHCEKWEAAEAEIVQKRIEWMERSK